MSPKVDNSQYRYVADCRGLLLPVLRIVDFRIKWTFGERQTTIGEGRGYYPEAESEKPRKEGGEDGARRLHREPPKVIYQLPKTSRRLRKWTIRRTSNRRPRI